MYQSDPEKCCSFPPPNFSVSAPGLPAITEISQKSFLTCNILPERSPFHTFHTPFPDQSRVPVCLSTWVPQSGLLAGMHAGLEPCPPTQDPRTSPLAHVQCWDTTPPPSRDSSILTSPQAQSTNIPYQPVWGPITHTSVSLGSKHAWECPGLLSSIGPQPKSPEPPSLTRHHCGRSNGSLSDSLI